MKRNKLHKIDSIFLIGIFIIAILGMVTDAIYWNDISEGGFPVFCCASVLISYALLIILLIYRYLKLPQNKENFRYVNLSNRIRFG